LFFVDILAPAVLSVRLDGTGLRRFPMPRPVGSIGLCESGRLLCALGQGIGILDPESGALSPYLDLPGEPAGNRLNDGKVGPDGAFWVGSMDNRGPDRQPTGMLWRVDGRGGARRIAAGCKVSNGLAFTADGRRMVHTDSSWQVIDLWDLDPATGEASNRRRIAEIDAAIGRPDGGAMDVEDHYWSAGIFGGHLNRFALDGRLVSRLPVPVPTPTMPCFCGPDLRALVVTSLSVGLPEETRRAFPLVGQVLIATTPAPVAGVPVGRVAGL
jgi:sugar lactone lactonase YvrE